VSENKSKRGPLKQYICDQLKRMREEGEAHLDIGAARYAIIPPEWVPYDWRLQVIRCKRGYAFAQVSDRDTGQRLIATTTAGDTFFISPNDILATVRKT